ncbi:MAG: exodeoxyribonuclease VII large subunit, partial [Verrucomicrobia bacterium]|nr:exodeoxyribonuclease VII large subunit [Verrucomicrobiota bacterium]
NIRSLLEARIGAVWVQGEVSNYRKLPSGHQYFTLKDNRAAIACVIFRSAMVSLRQRLADGAQVQVYGNVTVFEARGQYQLSVEIVQPRGLGLLQAKFEALKRKLEAEGLFESARKKPLPRFPRRIGIITSPAGAAIRDMLNVLRRRAPALEILISPVRVQGVGAATEIAAAIHELNTFVRQAREHVRPLDLIVLTRGGGSIEDLWEFNEEIVARAIAASALPVVSAVGHEIDFTIADFVADLRAPTPSAAAELIVSDAGELERRVSELTNCIQRVIRNFVAHEQARLRSYSERALGRELRARLQEATQQVDWRRETLLRRAEETTANARVRLAEAAMQLRRHDPSRELAARKQQLDSLAPRLPNCAAAALLTRRKQFERAAKILAVLGPDATLQRGYSITMQENGEIVSSVGDVPPGDRVRTRVRDGEFSSQVLGR